jgi:hypothetical protein
MAVGRSAFAHGYVRTYRRGTPRPLSNVDSWLVVHAAARLAEGLEAERATLVSFLDRARHDATR